MRSAAFVAILWCAVVSSGCGWILQSTVTGYSAEEVRTRSHTQSVGIRPSPRTAAIYRVQDGEEQLLSNGYTKDEIDYEIVETYKTNEPMTLLFLGGFADLAALVVGIVAVATADIDTAAKAISLTFGSMIGIAIPITEWTFAGVWSFEEPELLNTSYRPGKQQYVAREPGYRDLVVQASVPGPDEISLTLVAAPRAPPPPPARPEKKRSDKIVAVMEVVDVNAADEARRIEPLLLRNVGDQLRVFVASGGFRTVERGSQDAVLKAQLQELKAASYDSCYDERCQIELGKALAAQYILRAQVTRFGASCVLNGELIDLGEEVVVAAGSSRGGCAPEGFFKMTEQLAQTIIDKAN